VRAGHFSRTAAERKRRSHALPEDSSAADPPRPALSLSPAEKADRVAVLQKSLNGKAPTFDAHALGQGGSQP
jgi:hypothetical protein